MSNIIIITIILFILLNIPNKYRNTINIFDENSICYKIIKARDSFSKNIHYLPHSRCGISNHLIDLFNLLLLSLVVKRKLQCILKIIL